MDFESSPQVVSSQDAPHPRLEETVLRHLSTEYQEKIPTYAQQGFTAANEWVLTQAKPIILDSGCGTAQSSLMLAAQHPQCCVIGIDKSEQRLGRGLPQPLPDNLLLVRNDCIHFWRLAVQQQWSIEQHYLLYPNPWPKPGHLQRRWHAHAIFPTLLELGGQLTVRTNWRVYAQEFARALNLVLHEQGKPARSQSASLRKLNITTAMTAHELKYLRSGHALYEVKKQLEV